MFPPQLSTTCTEGWVHKCSSRSRSTLKSKNNTNPSDYITGTIQRCTKVNDLESNNFSSAAGAYAGCSFMMFGAQHVALLTMTITAEKSVYYYNRKCLKWVHFWNDYRCFFFINHVIKDLKGFIYIKLQVENTLDQLKHARRRKYKTNAAVVVCLVCVNIRNII